MDLKGRKVLVVGLGKTGVALARFLSDMGARVSVTDKRPAHELGTGLKEIEGCVEAVELGCHRVETFLRSDLIVLSPGVPSDIGPIMEAERRGVEVMGELDLVSPFLRAPVIAVTGTNGKTTTTTLLGEVFSRAGKEVWVGGNIGRPLVDLLLEGSVPDYVICEVSSFQLERVRAFRPFIGIVLNISENHLDRHGSILEYGRIKFRLFANQGPGDYAIINGDDPLVSSLSTGLPSRVITFSSTRTLERGIWLNGKGVIFSGRGLMERYDLDGLTLRGRHNLENVMAVIGAAGICGLERDAVVDGIRGFRGLAHRIEFVREWRGVRFYNDSKATNPGAVERALESMDRRVILLLGGRDKGVDYSSLNRAMKGKVRVVVLFGESRERIRGSLDPSWDIREANGLDEAFSIACREARPGEAVLLSPACSSFDAFGSYEERGNRFKELVGALR